MDINIGVDAGEHESITTWSDFAVVLSHGVISCFANSLLPSTLENEGIWICVFTVKDST